MAEKISAVICTYNRYDVLVKAIDSVLTQSLDRKLWKLYIIDNSPDQEQAAKWQEKYKKTPNMHYHLEPIPGLSNARNVAAKICGTKYISFLDDDAIASTSWLEKVLEAFEKYGDDAGIVGGRVDPMWAKPRPSWLGDKLLGHVSVVNWGGALRIAGESEWFAGANISFVTDLINKFGGFSTSLGRIGSGNSLLSNEESDLVHKIQNAGKKMIYAPEAQVDHLVEEKRLDKGWFRRRLAWQAVSDFIMDSDAAIAKTQDHWNGVKDYYNHIPPEYRSLKGLFYETDDPGMFEWQLGAIYMATQLNLSGFKGLEA